jgi:hypothetical protein
MFEPHRGKYIAVFHQAILGSDANGLSLRLDWAKRLQVHPERIVLAFIPSAEWI